jgi:hypothetical protein
MSGGIAYENWVTPTATAVNATGTSNVIGTIANLRSPQLSDVWGSSNNTGGLIQLVAFWNDNRPLSAMGLLDFRFTTLSNVRFRFGYLNVGGANVYFDTIVRAPQAYPDGFLRHDMLILPTPVTARGAFIDISAVSGGLGAFSIGRMWAGPFWRPSTSILRPWRAGVVDPGQMAISRGRQGYESLEQKARTLELRYGAAPLGDCIGTGDNSVMDLQQLAMRIGTTRHVFATPRTDAHAMHRLGFYGHCTEGLQLEHAGGDQLTAGMRFVELM